MTAKRELGLEYLSVFGLPLLEYADLAARLECDFISLNLGGPANRMEPYPPESLRTDAGLRQRLVRSVRDLGLRIVLAEGFGITPTTTTESHTADLDLAAELGATAICAISFEKDRPRMFEQFAALADAAAERGMIVTTELGAGTIRNVATAHEALEGVGHPGFKLLIDTMHFFRRGGGSVEALAALPAGAIGHVQLCDAPLPAPHDDYMAEALFNRRGLGDGDLPLEAAVGAIPAGIPVGLEIPLRVQAEAGLGPFERLQPSVIAARSWLDR